MTCGPDGADAFQLVELAALRANQVTRGCRAKVDGDHGAAVPARREVAEGKVLYEATNRRTHE